MKTQPRFLGILQPPILRNADEALNAAIERELARLQLTPEELAELLDQVRRDCGNPKR